MEDDQILTPSSNDTQSATPSPLTSILSDPAMLARLGSVMSALQSNTVSPAPLTSHDSPPQPTIPSTDGLASILSDPSLIERLPQIIATLKPLLDAGLLAKPTVTASEPAVAVSAPMHTPTHDRDNLLLSLKPFLSSERREAVDAILRIEKLGELLKQLK